MCKQCHLAPCLGRSDEHVECQIGDSEFARNLGGGIVLLIAIEVERGGLCDAGGIRYAEDLEVVVLIEPVACNGFAEPELDVAVEFEYSVSRQRFAEQHGRTRIFRTADDGRCLGYKS